MAARRLDDELAALERVELSELRKKWTSLSDAPVPRVSAGLLRYAIAYELQVAAHGGQPRDRAVSASLLYDFLAPNGLHSH